MTHKQCFRLEREARSLHQLMPGAPEAGSGSEPEYGRSPYESLGYAQQMEYMQDNAWMNPMLAGHMHMRMDRMQNVPWYQQTLEGGFPFDALTQGHYMPYGYFSHGSDWWQGHPAWSSAMPTPSPSFDEPPYPEPTPGRYGPVAFTVRRELGVTPRIGSTGSVRPAPRPIPRDEPAEQIPRRTPYPEAPQIDRTPSHPYDRSGRLAAAYAPYFNSDDPTVRAAAQRWWDQAIRILERHPNDEVIFNQLVRGARENLGRATQQHTRVETTQREWSERVGEARHSMRVSVPSGDRAAAIIITRNGDFNDRILYYPNSSSPFWDMRSADRAREWGIVFRANTFATGQFPNSVDLQFYGPGRFGVSGVAGVRVPQSLVVIGQEAEGHQRTLSEQDDRPALREMTLDFGEHEARAIEIEDTVSLRRTRMQPGTITDYADGFTLRSIPGVAGRYVLRFYRPGTYRVGRIFERDGGIRWETVVVGPPARR